MHNLHSIKLFFHTRIITFLFSLILIFSSCQYQSGISELEFEEIKSGFISPSEENTIWCYWYWINDDISKEGITKDLMAMKEAGIGAAFIGNINPAGVDGKVPMLSESWWSHMVHAVTEGKRIGVDIGIFNCPGWSQSGGPWVTSEMAMRYLTFSETKVSGPGAVNVKLVQPKIEFQDTHTLAFSDQDMGKRSLQNLEVQISSDPGLPNLGYLVDENENTFTSFDVEGGAQVSFQFSLPEDLTARQLSLTPGEEAFKCQCSLYAEIDGQEELVRNFNFDRSNFNVNVGPISKGPLAISLNEVTSNQFRLDCKNFISRTRRAGFAEVNISEAPVLEQYIEKQLGKMHPTPLPNWDTYVWETQNSKVNPGLVVETQQVIDVSDYVSDDGQLVWDAPEGEWTIMRIGMTPTGTKNSPSAPQGQGYEIDKMNSKLAKFHFDNFVGEFLKRIPVESKSAFKYVIADSYEMGSQNWTDNYEVKFKEKFGYDPVKYLPVLSGRIVGGVEESERFLWDLRRSVADDVAYEYVGGLKKASNPHDLQTWLENYGHWGFPSEFMMYGGQSDLIGGEFWNEGSLGNIECKASSSTSHTYGKGRTSAEAFTASGKSYMRHPAMLKKRGDWCFTEGINHLVLHLYIQQPDDNRKPGMNAWFSTEFNRHNTWFGQADHYFDYLRRCQHMLQQGQYAADVCYFIGENAPIMTGGRIPEIPKGYSYDYINAEVILERLAIRNGKFVLPDGMSYEVMVLPPINSMRPELLAKLEELVQQGGVILGSPPKKSPSLKGYPECDQQVLQIADKLWAEDYANGKMEHTYGEGLVVDGYELNEVFDKLNIKKDVDVPDDIPILWTHRTMPGMDIYFVTNQSDDELEINPAFRVNQEMKPQLWDAVTGEIRLLNEYTKSENGISVPLYLKAEQSWFVVFTSSDNEYLDGAYQSNFPETEVVQKINQPFTVDFKNKDIGPGEPLVFKELQDWSKSANEKIKFYSGSAVYSTTFNMDQIPENADVFINLGELSVMAEVKLNASDVGGVWMAPYRLEVSGLLKEGENTLEVEVVNLWRNRLIKDKMLPADEKYTWIVTEDIKPNELPHVSGLLGPVTIEKIVYQ